MSNKIKVKTVEITFSENRVFQQRFCGKQHPVFTTIEDATTLLRALAINGPTLGYDKTDYVITWEDGYQHKGRYDLHHISQQQDNPNHCVDLSDHLRSFIEFLTGDHKPWHKTEVQYEHILNLYGMTPEKRQKCREWLETYEI